MSQRSIIVDFTVEFVIGVLILELTERQVTVINFALKAMEQAHKKKPGFLTRKGITTIEIEELRVILEENGDGGQRKRTKTKTYHSTPYL